MPEQAFYEKFSGWLVAGIASLLNLLFFVMRKNQSSRLTILDEKIDEIEEELKEHADALVKHDHVTKEQVNHCFERNDAVHDKLFKKVDDLHNKIDESRRENKSDINTVVGLLQNGSKR